MCHHRPAHPPVRLVAVRRSRPRTAPARRVPAPAPVSVVATVVTAAVIITLSAVLLGPPAAVAVDDGGGSGTGAGTAPTAGRAPYGRAGAGYRPPVDAPVLDPFREPSGPYGPGNRGLEYGTPPGAVARAIGDGVVVFAGPVAGRLVLSVVHPDGLRSSLTGLAELSVGVGAVVAAGDPVGRTGSRLHLGVRRDGRYLDPASLFGDGPPRHAVLVPLSATLR